MKSTILADLLAEGLQLWNGDNKLGYRLVCGQLTDTMRERLLQAKPVLLKQLQQGVRYSRCSSVQQRLWFLEQLDPGSRVYNMPLAWDLQGPLNLPALQQALQQLVNRHEPLRTSFGDNEGSPYQMIHDTAALRLDEVDLTGVEASRRRALLEEQLQESCVVPLDLTSAPLLRARVFRMDQNRHTLFLLFHHIAFDGWSEDLLLNELAQLYEANISGKPFPLPPLKMSFTDHVATRYDWFRGEVAEQQLQYWRKKLQHGLAPLGMPLDKPRPPLQSTNGALQTIHFDAALLSRLKQRAQKERVTLFMLLVAALNVLLYRYTGQGDIGIGIPVANRYRPEVEPLIGFFANTLVLRSDVSQTPTFSDLLKSVRDDCLQSYNHQDFPFEQLVDELQVERDPAHTPLFQVMFGYREVEADQQRLGNLRMKPLDVHTAVSRTDLSFWFRLENGSMRCSLEYCSDLFEAPGMLRLLKNLQALLREIAHERFNDIAGQVVLAPAEQRLMASWNSTGAGYARERCFPQLFEEVAEAGPERIAAICEDQQIRYGELNARANQLAAYLRGCGVKPCMRVGIMLNRSLDMLVGLLAIMKTGALYVPMDPEFPPDRLQYMCSDAGIAFLLSETALLQVLPEYGGTRILLDRQSEVIAAEDRGNTAPPMTPVDLAYVIYTSGSTGKPKGVALPHRAMVNFLTAMAGSPGLQADDRLLAVTTLSFDIAVLELYLPLLCGATVVIAPRETAVDARRLQKVLQHQQISIMQATPASWRMLLDTGWQPVPGFKALCGGEALTAQLCEQLLRAGADLWNMYGPTETCVWSSVERMSAEQERITIGRPILNTRFYIVDAACNRLPVGAAGELLIGGDGLADGYLNRPELTAERFIADPFSGDPQSRLYRTGDLARFLPDGRVECLGRSDHQVKIRGYRIEPGEIESHLSRHPQISAAVVVALDDGNDQKMLAAYLVANGDSPPDQGELRNNLRQTLPEYMIPGSFTFLAELPQTPNGKVDRKALPAPQLLTAAAINAGGQFQGASDILEMQLSKLWESVLGSSPIGIDDNFFHLGGHSLLAVRLFARIESSLGVALPLAALFRAPSIRSLAELIRNQDWSGSWSLLVPIRAGGSKPPLYCIHGAGGNVLLYRELAAYLGEDQPVYGIQAQGLDGSADFLNRFEDMAAHYLQEIRALQPEGPYYLSGYCLGGTLAMEVAHQLRAIGEQVALLAMFESYNIAVLDKQRLVYTPFRYYRKYQNLKFHLENLLALDMPGKVRFFRTKWDVETTRIRMNLLGKWSAITGRVTGKSATVLQNIVMDGINDAAQERYVPRVYPGKAILFRPRKDFIGMEDREYGWSGYFEEGLLIEDFPANPRGMLVEPFVKTLAERLTHHIDASLPVLADNKLW